jgi:tetratricopeptide (TPR) repeat protein
MPVYLALELMTCPSSAFAQVKKPASDSASDVALQQQYNLAQRLQSSQDFAQAGFQFRLFLAQALYRVAEDRVRIGDYTEASPLFDRALKLAPSHADIHIDYAEAALAAKDFSTARQVAESQLALYPADCKTSECEKVHRILGDALLGMGDAEAAKDQFAITVGINSSYENGYNLATAYLAIPDKQNAARVFAEMQASFGDAAGIHMDFGRAYGEADFPEDAIVEFKKAIAANDKMPEAHYSLGAAYLMRSGDTGFEQAETEFRTELRYHPNDYYSYSQLGYIAMSRHNLQEAEVDLRRATVLDPHNPDNFLLLGQIYTDTDRTTDAIAALRSAIAVTSDPTRNHYQIRGAHYQLGRLLIQTGDVAGGKKEMQIAEDLLLKNRALDQVYLVGKPLAGYQFPKAADTTPANPEAIAAEKDFEKRIGPAIADSYNNLGASAASERDYREALDDFEQAAAWNPQLDGLDYNWGRAAYAAKQFRVAATCLGRYLEAHPDATGVRGPLGMSRFMLGDYSGAVKALAPMASDLDATPLLAYAYDDSLVQVDYDRGIDRLLTLEKANPTIAVIHLAIGKAYLGHQHFAEAEPELRTAVRLKPTDTDALYSLAADLYALKSTTEAANLLQQLATSAEGRQDPALLHRIGKLQLAHGDTRSALSTLQSAAQLSPKDQSIQDDLSAASHRVAQP